MEPRTHTSAMDTLGVHDGPGHCRSGASLWSYRLLAVSVLLLGLPLPTLQQTGGVNSIGARSYCYSVPDPNLPASCHGVRLASSKNTTQAFRLGDSTTSYLELEYVPLRNISEIERIANATNGTVSYTDTALGTFFPKVDVYAVLSMNGSDVIPYLDARKRSWQDVTLNFHLLHNATLFKAGPKSWFTYMVDTDTLYYIPYRGVIINLWNGLVSSVQWETVSKTFSLCPPDISLDMDSCPIICNSTNFEGCDIKVHLMWAGTDAQGKPLQSVEKSIYRLEHFF